MAAEGGPDPANAWMRLPSLPTLGTGLSTGSTSWLTSGLTDIMDMDAPAPGLQRRRSARLQKEELPEPPPLSFLLSRTATVKQPPRGDAGHLAPATASVTAAGTLQRVRSSKRVASTGAHSTSGGASQQHAKRARPAACSLDTALGPWHPHRVVQTHEAEGGFGANVVPRESAGWFSHSPSAEDSVLFLKRATGVSLQLTSAKVCPAKHARTHANANARARACLLSLPPPSLSHSLPCSPARPPFGTFLASVSHTPPAGAGACVQRQQQRRVRLRIGGPWSRSDLVVVAAAHRGRDLRDHPVPPAVHAGCVRQGGLSANPTPRQLAFRAPFQFFFPWPEEECTYTDQERQPQVVLAVLKTATQHHTVVVFSCVRAGTSLSALRCLRLVSSRRAPSTAGLAAATAKARAAARAARVSSPATRVAASTAATQLARPPCHLSCRMA